MNPKGVPTKGMWRKVFVKALPNAIVEPLGNISCTFALFVKLHTF